MTQAQRRDYLMASLSWLRDLMMLGFALLLLVITGLLSVGSGFALMPLRGNASLIPTSLIIIATLCMTWTLRHWTSITWRRAARGLIISLSASWITALACIQGLTHREGVFLRTSKTGSTHRQLRTALRLTRVETVLALALYTAVGLLLALKDPAIVLLVILVVQATVYLCAPIAALWNMRAQRVPDHEYRARFVARQSREPRRSVPAFVTVGFSAALALAVLGGAAVAVLAEPKSDVQVQAPLFAPTVSSPARPVPTSSQVH
jgi:hypothetical protein